MPHRLLTPVCALVAVTVIATVAAINQAIPSLSSSGLRPGPTTLLWIVDAYVVTFAAALLPAGAIADRIGLRTALLTGLSLLSVGVLAAALAPDAGVLIAARVVSGLGAALCLPTSLSIQLATVSPTERARTVGTWTAATGLGGAFGNVVGGALIQAGGWRGLFWGFLPVGLVCLAAGAAVFPAVPRHPRPLDPLGAALSAAGFLALLVGLVEGPTHGWTSTAVLGYFVASAVLIATYVRTARHREHPLVDPRLFAVADVRASALGIVGLFVALFGLFLSYGQYLQVVKQEQPVVAGLAVLPLVVPFFLCSRLAPRLAGRWGLQRTAGAGLVVAAGGVLLISTWSESTSYPTFAATLLVAGIGLGLAGPPLSQSLVSALPVGRAGVGAALNSTAREVGSALGVAIVGTVTSTRFAAAGFGHRSAAAVVAGLHGSAADAARDAFAHAAGYGLRISVAVLVVALAVMLLWWARSPAADGAATTLPTASTRLPTASTTLPTASTPTSAAPSVVAR